MREQHPEWIGLRYIAADTSERTDKRTGKVSSKMRFYSASLPAEAKRILDASRAHWGIEDNLHWTLNVTFRKDAC
jgi:predicted transposase YbfD/YdcC